MTGTMVLKLFSYVALLFLYLACQRLAQRLYPLLQRCRILIARWNQDEPVNAQFGKAHHGIPIERYAGSHADLQFSQQSGASIARGGLAQLLKQRGGISEVKRKTVPPVGLLDRPAQHRGSAATYHDWRGRLLHGMWIRHYVMERDVATGIGRGSFAPDGAHGCQILIGTCPSFVKRNAQRLELLFGPANANPHDQSATGKHIQARQFLRQDERLVLRKQ